MLAADHDPEFTSAPFKELTRRLGSRLLVGSAHHKNTDAKAELVDGVQGGTLRAFANTAERTTGTCGCPTPSSPSKLLLPRRAAR